MSIVQYCFTSTEAQDGHLDFHAAPELCPGGGGIGKGRLYTYRYTVTTRMTCIKMGSDESHFKVSLIVRNRVTRQRPQTTTFEEKGEPKWNRTDVLLLTCLTPNRSAKRADDERADCGVANMKGK